MRQVNDIIACKKKNFFTFASSKNSSNNSDSDSMPLPLDWIINATYLNEVQKSLRITKKQIIFSYEVMKYEAILIETGGNQSNEYMMKYQKELKGKLEKLHKFDLDQIKNSEGVKDELQYKVALNLLYNNNIMYLQDIISIVTNQLKKKS